MEELRELVIRARAGDLRAYGSVVERLQDMACGYAYALLGDFHLAEDAVQEAFLHAYRDLAALRDPSAFPGWLRRILFKQCDRLTRRKHLDTAPLDAAAGEAAPTADPAERAERREMADNVLRAIRSLPEPQRMVTTLFYIDGYSQDEIAGFLDVPVSTVKNRLLASRRRLKERMLSMVADTLQHGAPDERFSRKVIEALLARPRPLEIEGHPVRRVWELIRGALPDYEVVLGEEIEDREALEAVQEDMDRAFHLGYLGGEEKALRTQMTVTTLKAIRGRKPPVRLLAPGRVFRPCGEDATHVKVFHQCDGICVEAGADLAALKTSLQQVLAAVLGPAKMRWVEHDFGFVEHGLELHVDCGNAWLDISGSGTLKAETLRDAGLDPEQVGGFAWGLGLERLAMIKFGIDDVRKLWKPPFV